MFLIGGTSLDELLKCIKIIRFLMKWVNNSIGLDDKKCIISQPDLMKSNKFIFYNNCKID